MTSFRIAVAMLLLAGATAPAQAQAPDSPAVPGRDGVTRPAPAGKDGVTRPAPGSPHDADEHPGAVSPGGRSAAPS
jgi:hypothetical protein